MPKSSGSQHKQHQEKQIKVYFRPKPSINVCLKIQREEVQDLTLKELVITCLRILKQDYLLDVHLHGMGYSLYVADKAGKKNEGYPEMDLEEKVRKTKIRKFYLEEISGALSMISKEINLENKYGFEKKPKVDCVCCRLFQKFKC